MVGNAVKFTSQGTINVELEQVRSDQEYLMIRVSDSGIGMTESQLEGVFDPFAQADTSITRKFGGTGLGLAIAKKFANAMGGDISVTSELDVGSQFEFSIPVGDQCSSEQVDHTDLSCVCSFETFQKWDGEFLTGRKILIVDDAETNRELLQIMLSEFDVSIVCCEDGQEALHLVEGQRDIDVVLMDMMMPVMDGYSATREIRKRGFDLPIIALTANSMADDEGKCIRAGCDDYLPKPLELNVLLEKLERHLPHQKWDSATNGCEPQETRSDSAKTDRFQKELAKLSKRFFEKLLTRVDDFQSALNERDFEGMALLGHWLKGTAAPFGLKELVEAGKLLDEAGKANDIVGCVEAIEWVVSKSETYDFNGALE